MRYFYTLILLLSASLGADPTNVTQDTIQSNDAINSPTSVMQNTQINSGVTHDSYGGGVSCARTTLQAGIIQSFNGQYDEPQVYVGFNMPLGASTCDIAAQKQISLTHQRTRALQEQIIRNNESHDDEMKKRDLQYADLLAKICLNYHGKLLAQIGTLMESECRKYKPFESNHSHSDVGRFDKANYNRISAHK